jgi:hypothetical protein
VKRSLLLLAILVFNAGWAIGETPLDTIKTTPAVLESLGIPHRPFGVGERLVFSIEWGFIKAGDATLEVRSLVRWKGEPCYLFMSEAWSNSSFTAFFPVRDVVKSFAGARDLASRKFEKHLREGKFAADVEVGYDQTAHTVHYPDGQLVATTPLARDILASFYYARTQPLVVGKSFFIDNHTDRVNYPLEVNVLRKEHVRVHAGEFDCIVVQPVLRYPGLFEQKGKLTIWLTDDARKMPVMMRSKIVIGSINAALKEVHLGQN